MKKTVSKHLPSAFNMLRNSGENPGITDFFWFTELSSKTKTMIAKNNCGTWFFLEFTPFEFPEFSCSNPQTFAGIQLADNRELTEFLFLKRQNFDNFLGIPCKVYRSIDQLSLDYPRLEYSQR